MDNVLRFLVEVYQPLLVCLAVWFVVGFLCRLDELADELFNGQEFGDWASGILWFGCLPAGVGISLFAFGLNIHWLIGLLLTPLAVMLLVAVAFIVLQGAPGPLYIWNWLQISQGERFLRVVRGWINRIRRKASV